MDIEIERNNMDYTQPPRKLAASTISCYRTRLRKLRRLYPYLPEGENKQRCYREMLKLADVTGMELEDPILDRGPGRPRFRTDIDEVEVPKEVEVIAPHEHDPEVRKWIPGTQEFADRLERAQARVQSQPLTSDQQKAHSEAANQEELIRKANDLLADKIEGKKGGEE